MSNEPDEERNSKGVWIFTIVGLLTGVILLVKNLPNMMVGALYLVFSVVVGWAIGKGWDFLANSFRRD